MEIHDKILRVISERTIENPIVGHAIGELVGLDVRSVADRISELRMMGFKIGSSKMKPMGYFLARKPEELADTSARMKQGCLVQLAQLKRMNTWDGNEPTIWEGDALYHVESIIKETSAIV